MCGAFLCVSLLQFGVRRDIFQEKVCKVTAKAVHLNIEKSKENTMTIIKTTTTFAAIALFLAIGGCSMSQNADVSNADILKNSGHYARDK